MTLLKVDGRGLGEVMRSMKVVAPWVDAGRADVSAGVTCLEQACAL
jgi:hypothetical protein